MHERKHNEKEYAYISEIKRLEREALKCRSEGWMCKFVE